MSSYQLGKEMIKHIIKRDLPKWATCLDVGACDGTYWDLLHDHLVMDAVEVWEPNIKNYNLKGKYRMVLNEDIRELKYIHYDLIIFGDVIEHMKTEEAQRVLEYAKEHSDEIMVAVPYRYKQDAIYGNPYEKHIQDDLTEEIFLDRYKDFRVAVPYFNYGYFIWRKSERN